MNKRVMESLIKAGAMDCLGSRGALLQRLDRILWLSQHEQGLREKGQATMFDLWGESVATPLPEIELQEVDIPLKEKLGWERELLGLYLSDHPFQQAAQQLASSTTALCGQIDFEMAGQAVTVAGLVTSVRQGFTKSKRPFVNATLEDLVGSTEVTCWADIYQRTEELWVEGSILLIQGRVRARQEGVQVVCEQVRQYQPRETESVPDVLSPSRESRLRITMAQTDNDKEDLARLHQIVDIVRRYPGEDRVLLAIAGSGTRVNLEMPDLSTGYCRELHGQLAELVGEEAIKLET